MSQEIKRWEFSDEFDHCHGDLFYRDGEQIVYAKFGDEFIPAADYDAVVQERDALRVERAEIQGALTDAGTVPVEPLAEGVRHLTAERDALARRVRILETAAQDFVNKVESGRAQSRDSYAKFKAALAYRPAAPDREGR